jgi:hypothetical protein
MGELKKTYVCLMEAIKQPILEAKVLVLLMGVIQLNLDVSFPDVSFSRIQRSVSVVLEKIL